MRVSESSCLPNPVNIFGESKGVSVYSKLAAYPCLQIGSVNIQSFRSLDLRLGMKFKDASFSPDIKSASNVIPFTLMLRPPADVGEGVAAQISSSSSDRGSKLRGPSQNSPRAASKRHVNITKLLCCCSFIFILLLL
ncbi:hypothetical protein AVEN_208743-1 [Araneus ventricosus]|uniref:Uncharacterized protein n=1 Tax=Araneus ventricosus TaxID=182803 RepID=A0A4Y2KEN6_ARAVE|nr:hypothetical protein AVEN_208743-1 [Araneus ventricosus]